jgi:hypothetical protein
MVVFSGTVQLDTGGKTRGEVIDGGWWRLMEVDGKASWHFADLSRAEARLLKFICIQPCLQWGVQYERADLPTWTKKVTDRLVDQWAHHEARQLVGVPNCSGCYVDAVREAHTKCEMQKKSSINQNK